MNLDAYLTQLGSGNPAPPDSITVPDGLAHLLRELYTAAETAGRERGAQMIYVPGTTTFALGTVGEGGPTSMNIPVSEHPHVFGDVHAHPSASIGHAGGYSAHSMADLSNFHKTLTRPYFLQFVTSGPYLHAMVQVAGVSTWDNTTGKFFADHHKTEEDLMFDAVVRAAGGEDGWVALLTQRGADQDPAQSRKLYEEYKPKAGIGPLMQDLSVRHCAEFARQYTFFFYSGQGATLARV